MLLTIRDEQMRAFDEAMRRSFEERLVRHLRAAFPERAGGMVDGELLGLVREGTERAARYGIRAEADVAAFVELMVEFGAHFDLDPAAALLGSAALMPSARLALVRRSLEDAREEAEAVAGAQGDA